MTDGNQFVSPKLGITALLLENPEDARNEDICRQYASMRRIRGDGNCFYRAFCFGHLESVLHNVRSLQIFKEKVMLSVTELMDASFEESCFRDLLNTFVSVLEECEEDDEGTALFRLFNYQTISDSMVQYLRLLTSAYLQNHAEFFCHFVEAPCLKVYCTQEVETMAMECDHVEILALCEALGVSVHIASMEGGDGQCLVHHTIPEGAEPTVHLLYKTSHYDIVYPGAVN